MLFMRQNGCHLADNTFKRIFLNENVRISLKISLKFDPKGPINNIPALVQIMVWCLVGCLVGAKPLSEPMMFRLPTHICIIQRKWVKPDPRSAFIPTVLYPISCYIGPFFNRHRAHFTIVIIIKTWLKIVYVANNFLSYQYRFLHKPQPHNCYAM